MVRFAEGPDELTLNRCRGDPEPLERTARRCARLAEQAQEQVLGAKPGIA